MLSFFNKQKQEILAPVDGDVVSVSCISDAVFADKVIGDGVAIIPSNGRIVAPVTGTIVTVADTLHAIGIQNSDGLDILIHIGMDTVELNGQPFKLFVKKGDKVKTGQILCKVDLNKIKEAGHGIETPVIITNMDQVENIRICEGRAKAGETVVLSYTLA